MAARPLSQLQAAVQNLGFGTDQAAAQLEWLNTEYRSLGGLRRWKWLEARTTVATVAGTSSYTPSATDIRNYDRIYVADSAGNDTFMEWKPTQWVVERQHRFNQLSDRGIPRYWSLFAGAIQLYPIPDAVYTLQIDYTKNITPMAAPTDVPLLPEAYDDILVYGAAARAAARANNWIIRDDFRGQKQQLINEMLAEYAKDQTQNSDEVEWTGIWDNRMTWR